MPLTPSTTRELLATLGHQPKRFLGQNFLVDGNIVRKSLDLAGVVAGDAVVEIGPGLGTLTSALLEAGADVWAVEKDRTLHQHLTETLATQFPATFHLLEGDAVEHPLAALPPERAAEPFKVVANLPYAITTPWLDAVLAGPLPERIVVMLPQEPPQRYVAVPGSKTFGAISIFLQSAYTVAPGHKVEASCFYPRPDVDSYLLHLVRRPIPYIFPVKTKELIRSCFQQRRKQIGGLLRERLPDHGATWIAHLAAAGLSAQARPEAIPTELWRALAVRDSEHA